MSSVTSNTAEIPDTPASKLEKPFMEGILDKRRPSKKYLSIKYQKRWCVIHEDNFYYYESKTDKKQKGAFSLKDYKFEKQEKAPLTFSLKGKEKRWYEFICANQTEYKLWHKAVKTAIMYGKKKKKREPTLTHQSSVDDYSSDDSTQLPAKRLVMARGPVPSPPLTDRRQVPPPPNYPNNTRTKHRIEGRGPAPPPPVSNIASSHQRSFKEEDGYITVTKGPQRVKHSDIVQSRSQSHGNIISNDPRITDSGNEDLYLELLGDDQLPSNNGPINQDSSVLLREEPIYQNTNDPSLQYNVVLPRRMRNVQIDNPHPSAYTENDIITDSEEDTSGSEEDSSDSEAEDYENAHIF